MRAKTGITWRIAAGVTVGLQDGPMKDEQWEAMVEAGRRQGQSTGFFSTIVLIDSGPPPTSRQRMILNRGIEGLRWRAAAITDSAMIRLATTAMSWFQPGLRTFAFRECDAAIEYISAEAGGRFEIRAGLDLLRAQAGLPRLFFPLGTRHGEAVGAR
jgi:hypothetical protein